MRLEYRLELSDVGIPRFAVEAQEGIGKLFTLATMVFNVLETRPTAEIVFHGLNPDDPPRKINAFREIVESVSTDRPLSLTEGQKGRVGESSSYFQWLTVSRQSR